MNVTVTPLAGDPLEVTVACNGDPKGCPIAAVCPVPAVAAMEIVGVVLLLPPQAINPELKAKVIANKMDWRRFIAVLPSSLSFF